MLQILIYEKCHGSVTFLRLCDYLLGIILPAWKFAPPFEMTFSHVNVIVEYWVVQQTIEQVSLCKTQR